MNVVLLRVGIDSGCGGINSPLFPDGSFEFVPIPDCHSLDERTYGNTTGRKGRAFSEYFPKRDQAGASSQAMHVDPEFDSFTYGDPTPPKRGLAQMRPDDLLVFYAGMQGFGFAKPLALYLAGCFRVQLVGFAPSFTTAQLQQEFAANFHVRHPTIFSEQRDNLLLIKGGPGSRLFQQAHLVGESVCRENGTWWQMITPQMAEVFGRFGGIGSLQRSTPRWVEKNLVSRAEKFVESLA